MIAELIFWYMSKNEKEMLIRNADLTEEKRKIICTKMSFIPINIFFLNNVDIDELLISNRVSSSEKNYKYFIGFADVYKIKPCILILQKTST